MTRFIALLLAATATLATAQTPADAPPVEAPPPVAPAPPAAPAAPVATPAPRPGTVRVAMTTSEGPILLELDADKAPVTVANFLKYVDGKRLDGTAFYRRSNVPNAKDYGLVQGGVRYDPKRVLPGIVHEATTRTGLSHTDGTISMARNAPGTAAGDFFIIVGDMPYMNADPTQPGDNLGYAAFGHVVEGMDVVKRILTAPVSPTAGVGPMKGEMLAAPVRIVGVKRVKAAVPGAAGAK
jgi:peptidyl-prolyl cis-trans isomerase A (cyclophilin A)